MKHFSPIWQPFIVGLFQSSKMISWFQACDKTGDQRRATFFGIHFSLVNRNSVIIADLRVIKKCKEITRHFEISLEFVCGSNVGNRICIVNPMLMQSKNSPTHKGNWTVVNAEIGTIAGSQELKGSKSSILIPKTRFILIFFGK